jgi:hypothetical protein
MTSFLHTDINYKYCLIEYNELYLEYQIRNANVLSSDLYSVLVSTCCLCKCNGISFLKSSMQFSVNFMSWYTIFSHYMHTIHLHFNLCLSASSSSLAKLKYLK